MPDWSYRTAFRPLLSVFPWPVARSVALGSMGWLNRLPGGGTVIDLLGHLRTDAEMRGPTIGSIQLRSPVGLSPALDTSAIATGALARFGFGFVEVGPVIRTAGAGVTSRTRWSVHDQEIIVAAETSGTGIEAVERAATAARSVDVALIVRWPRPAAVTPQDSVQWDAVLSQVARCATAISLPSDWLTTTVSETNDLGRRWISHARELGVAAVLGVVTGREPDSEWQLLATRLADGTLDGLLIDTALMEDGGWHLRPAAFDSALAVTRRWTSLMGDSVPIIVSGGIHEVWQSQALLDAGAAAIEVDSGLAFTGPGFVKRINESLLARQFADADRSQAAARPGLASTERVSNAGDDRSRTSPQPRTRAATLAWLWTLLLGASLLGGGLLTLVLGLTRVVLPYDEAMSGISREQLSLINERLLPFMTHDRVTLSATMLAAGTLYVALSWFGVRRGREWARKTIVWSALAGFFSFFTFLGFGYFDALHAFVSGILLQFTLLAMHSPMPPRRCASSDLVNDRAWITSQWGQLLFVIHGAALITAGLVICAIGSTTVFVTEDLDFMNTTAPELCGANPRLLPLIAHDRATFGGMLLTTGITVLLATLWGFQRGQRWLWWSLLLSGSAAYLGTVWVHWHVGYGSLVHLIPAYGGLLTLWLSCGLSRRYLWSCPLQDPRLVNGDR